jgi:hypothetical protein
MEEILFENSTQVVKAVYTPEVRTLDVWFKSGVPYRYLDVPAERFEGLRTAESPGSYLARNVRPFHMFPDLCLKLECMGCHKVIQPEDLALARDSFGHPHAWHTGCMVNP